MQRSPMTTNRPEKELSRWDLDLLCLGHAEEPTNKHPEKTELRGARTAHGAPGRQGKDVRGLQEDG